MVHPVHNHLGDLSLGFSINYLILYVDRILIRDCQSGRGPSTFDQGTRQRRHALFGDAKVCCSCDYLYYVVLSRMPSSLFVFVVLSITQIIFAGNSGVM